MLRLLQILFLLASPLLAAAPLAAADLGVAPRPAAERPTPDARAASLTYLERRAVLLMIRATFDVVQAEDIPRLLAADAQALDSTGPDEDRLALLDRDLLAEASYYIVSLRYLVEFGGAAWPADRPEAAYVNDAIVLLDALLDDLVDSVAARTDTLPILRRVQAIRAQTEGYTAVPSELDMFADRDALAAAALAAHGPWAAT